MTAMAHIGGVPVEEGLVSLLAGSVSALLIARAWLSTWLRHRRP